MKTFIKLLLLLFISSLSFSQTTKPFTRWWWMGNAISKEGIKYHLEEFKKVGLGGVEITPIYGVKGQEENFIPFLSRKYLDLLDYTCSVADSLGLEVDMVLGTGWPYGGPQVEPHFAATKLTIDTFQVAQNQSLELTLNPKNPNAEFLNLLYFSDQPDQKNISSIVDKNLQFNFVAPYAGTLYAVYADKTNQKVKRAAPGGEGFTVDHYSSKALKDYLIPYNESLKSPIRAIFNDSYEVYGTDFSPGFFDEFIQRRGYDLRPYLDLIYLKTDSEIANRIRSDYRETLSDMLLENFDQPWTSWANSKGYKTKLQAHGSPGNLLDFYASADIPECETFGSMPFDIPGFRRELEDIREGDADPVMLKFSSSAGHIMGKPLISSESFTWLRDHFKVALSQTKPELEELFLNGVNHTFLHGSTYSDPKAAWPGWKFYASVNFAPQMEIWRDAPALFNYTKNVQEYLQAGQPDNEIALYWPIYDIWQDYLKGKIFVQLMIHGLEEWLLGRPFYELANELMNQGYLVDFFSDRFLNEARVVDGMIQFPGGKYKAIIVPDSKVMPISTMKKLIELKNKGGKVFFQGFPETVPGFNNYESREQDLNDLLTGLPRNLNIVQTLESNQIHGEPLTQAGLKFIRREIGDQQVYFIVNHGLEDFDDFVKLNSPSENYFLFDPDNMKEGMGSISEGKIRLQLKSGKSIIVVSNKKSTKNWDYQDENSQPIVLNGEYELRFLRGGEEIPSSRKIRKLESWTNFGKTEESFSGTAEYTTYLSKPKGESNRFLLKFPDVRESVRVFLNGEYQGTVWSNPFEIELSHLKDKNELKLEVTNLSANRLRALEMAGKEWKIFYEINMVNKDYKTFDATQWQAMPSGIIGEISLIPLK